MTRLPFRKQLSHKVKSALYKSAALDAWLDDRMQGEAEPGTDSAASRPGGHDEPVPGGRARRGYHHLFPERAGRAVIFLPEHRTTQDPASTGIVRILTLVPPEDTGGASRPARLAAEFYRRGFGIDWQWALDIYPWPQRRRPQAPAVRVAHLSEKAPLREPSLVLIEAPHPAFVELLDDVPAGVPIIYDQIDLWHGDLALGWFSRAAEDTLIERADLLFGSARSLCAKIESRTQRPCLWLPNAVDPQLFTAQNSYVRPRDLRPGRPTCVYIGALWGEWLDLAAIGALATAMPEAEIHLIGRRGERPLPEAPNIHILGERSRESIPAYLAHADVALAPFRAGAVANAVSPLKVFEALAMGCPVAATSLPEVAGLPGVASPAAGLLAATREAAALAITPEASSRFAAEHSWAARVETVLREAQACSASAKPAGSAETGAHDS
jgi:glycosyltransferase involved in cell wall biosynthesis